MAPSLRAAPAFLPRPHLPLRRAFALALAALAALILFPVASPAAPADPVGPRVIAHDDAGLTLVWTPPAVTVRLLDDGAAEVAAAGLTRDAAPGAPLLPVASLLLAVPPGASPSILFASSDETWQPLPGPIALAPVAGGVTRDDLGRPIAGLLVAAHSEAQAGPAGAVSLQDAGVMAGVRLARLSLYPAVPDAGGLRLARAMTVTVAWQGAITEAGTRSGPAVDAVRRAVANPWDAAPWPSSPVALATSTPPPALFVEITATGVYSLTHADLSAHGLAAADPRNLRLWRGADEIAYEWHGDDDATLEPGEWLAFYAQPRFSRWTTSDVYRLEASSTAGRRMTTRDASPAGLPPGVAWAESVAESNQRYTPDAGCGLLPPGRDGDRWAWDALQRGGQASRGFTLQTPAVDASAPASLTVWLIGCTDLPALSPDHRVLAALNGVPLGAIEWNGKLAITATLAVPPGSLNNVVNNVTLSLPGLPSVDVETVLVDALAARYVLTPSPLPTDALFATAELSTAPAPGGAFRVYLPWVASRAGPVAGRAYTVTLQGSGPFAAYDVTDPLCPQRLSGFRVAGATVSLGDDGRGPRRYLVTTAPRRPAAIRARAPLFLTGDPGADYLIIVHPDFAPALGPLVDLRRGQGFSVTVASALGVYDAYGDGRPDPETIRSFIADAYAAWQPPLSHLLLVGNGNFDPRGYLPGALPSYLPPYLADVDPWVGETAADNRYAAVDGADTLPDLLVGRLPVSTLSETVAVVDKLVRYETAAQAGDWRARSVFVADDADPAGDFAGQAEAIASGYITAPYAARRIYYTPPTTSITATRQATLQSWQDGALVHSFTGHSSWQQWALENFLSLADIPTLTNDGRWPVVAEMTCFTGAFQRPEPTLDRALLLRDGGGAVAVWGPTGLGLGTGHDSLARSFYQATFEQSVATVGEAVLAGKLSLYAGGIHLDLLDTFTLLGDPATRFQRPAP